MTRPYAQLSPFALARGEATAGGESAAAGTGAFPFKGAMVRLTSDETLTNSVAIPWDAEIYDHGGWWVIGSPTRFTVLAGVTMVELTVGVHVTTVGADMQWRVDKNGARVEGGTWYRQDDIASGGNSGLSLQTAVLEVVAGDYLELVPGFASGSPSLRQDIAGGTFFSIKAVETTETGKTATVQTSDATQTVIASGAMAADSAHTIRATGHGREDATGDTYHFEIFGGARNEGGTSSAPTPNVTEVADAGASTWDATMVANDTSDEWEIKVTGEAGHTIDWTVTWFEIVQ
jgi:hypothetical protein